MPIIACSYSWFCFEKMLWFLSEIIFSSSPSCSYSLTPVHFVHPYSLFPSTFSWLSCSVAENSPQLCATPVGFVLKKRSFSYNTGEFRGSKFSETLILNVLGRLCWIRCCAHAVKFLKLSYNCESRANFSSPFWWLKGAQSSFTSVRGWSALSVLMLNQSIGTAD